MIELGSIRIKDESTLVESRNKILRLAENLRFDPINATRLATMTSELIREMLRTGYPSKISVELGLKKGIFGLILKFSSKQIGRSADTGALEAVFDGVEISREEDMELLTAFRALPEADLDISEEFIAREKAEIGRLTREELYRELDHAYSDLKSKTTQLIQTEKLGTVGTMVAGVAHELNNPMMGLINFIQYCIKHTDEADRRYTVLKDAEHEARRCIEIVDNLLTFSRMEKEGEEDRQLKDVAEIVERVVKLLSYRFEKEGVRLVKQYATDLPKVWMKVNNIQQVFLNIMNNALDVLKESDKKEITVDLHREGGHVQVTVTDTGCGMPEGIVKKIFDPFFTTKDAGKGTGLGLSICQSIIKDHEGEIVCESRVGQGTAMKVLLPITLRRGIKNG